MYSQISFGSSEEGGYTHESFDILKIIVEFIFLMDKNFLKFDKMVVYDMDEKWSWKLWIQITWF